MTEIGQKIFLDKKIERHIYSIESINIAFIFTPTIVHGHDEKEGILGEGGKKTGES